MGGLFDAIAKIKGREPAAPRSVPLAKPLGESKAQAFQRSVAKAALPHTTVNKYVGNGRSAGLSDSDKVEMHVDDQRALDLDESETSDSASVSLGNKAARPNTRSILIAADQLSEDQQEARRAVLQALQRGDRQMVLTGPAGSGKTTLMRQILADVEDLGLAVSLVAPTGKAALRLSQLTGRTATTVHRPLYEKCLEDNKTGDLSFSAPRAVVEGRALVLCDEASMLSQEVYADLFDNLPRSVSLLCVGDREQLPPVNGTWGANFEEPTACLTQVHRQALQSPILGLATHIRQGGFWRNYPQGKAGYEYRKKTKATDVVRWLLDARENNEDVVLLAYSNKTRMMFNEMIRDALNRREHVEPGDRIVCTRNNANVNLCNGDVRQVERVREEEGLTWLSWREGGGAYVVPWLLSELRGGTGEDHLAAARHFNDEVRRHTIRAEYGECLTVHRAQGSQWKKVGVFVDFDWMRKKSSTGEEDYRRLLYTAITRAEESLILFEP